MASKISVGIEGGLPSVTLHLIEDASGKRLVLPDGRSVAGVRSIDVVVEANEVSTMTIQLNRFGVTMDAPTSERNHDAER
ncbi:hypothetical protein [Chitinasiproducens palmae]|uniref:Uncharacterized protein n=1 Tax=Chitinasiproducens palmae TaxID=1770053 RepID=A0A1H2PU32_9BURK|nr:hypothetical protein [Chitinasiproducens palmae]SDV49818.1 hypothetical protein SAMN05216551_109164 [Chitinasiproducens palmae]